MEGFKLCPVKDNEKYMINQLGEIICTNFRRSGFTKTLKLTIDVRGYYCVQFSINGKIKKYSIHRLVAITFIPNPMDKPMVNHINGDKLDNRVENLEWCTARENIVHALETGLFKPKKGKDHYMYGKEPHNKGINNRILINCKQCGKKVKTYQKSRKFCSKSCSSIYMNANTDIDRSYLIERNKRVKHGEKAVLQYDLKGNFIKEFVSMADAIRNVPKASHSGISMVCNDKYPHQKHAGFKWKFKKRV